MYGGSFQHYKTQRASRILEDVRKLVRYLWALPNTVLGLILCLAAFPRGRVAIVDGVVEAQGPMLRWALRRLPIVGGASAMTLGHVVLGSDAESLDWARTHEHVHVAQYERWGPLFLPAYVCASAWAALSGRHFYLDNVFEVEAFSSAGSRPSSTHPLADSRVTAGEWFETGLADTRRDW